MFGLLAAKVHIKYITDTLFVYHKLSLLKQVAITYIKKEIYAYHFRARYA